MEGIEEVLLEEVRRACLPRPPDNKDRADLNHILDPVGASLEHRTLEVHILEDSEVEGMEVEERGVEEEHGVVEEGTGHEEEGP
jgi:hypothetical protein